MADLPDLPLVDEHRVRVQAAPSVVWTCLGRSLPGQHGGDGVLLRLLGAEPSRAMGEPLRAGSTIQGFAVVEAVPGERLVLAGRHRFSVYRLVFELGGGDGVVELVARSEALFPGVPGRVYRGLVIDSGGHRAVVRRWLRGIRSAAEAAETA